MSTFLLTLGLYCFSASIFTFFTGFGLGTLLTPLLLFYFSLETAITVSAVVHLIIHFYKFWNSRKNLDRKLLLRFGGPAMFFGFIGAICLRRMGGKPPLYLYSIGLKIFAIQPLSLVVGTLLVIFVVFEVVRIRFAAKPGLGHLFLGGAISGFFGGASGGNQGSLRKAYLLPLGLNSETLVATSAAIACLVDLSRVAVYSSNIFYSPFSTMGRPLFVAILAACVGSWFGKTQLHVVPEKGIQRTSALALIVFGGLLASGLLRR